MAEACGSEEICSCEATQLQSAFLLKLMLLLCELAVDFHLAFSDSCLNKVVEICLMLILWQAYYNDELAHDGGGGELMKITIAEVWLDPQGIFECLQTDYLLQPP